MSEKAVRIFECDICHERGPWADGWMHRTLVHDTWDEVVHVCSEACALRWQAQNPQYRQ